ncbi:hypothetical protein BsWGS_04592 [Bradybaena similaris]
MASQGYAKMDHSMVQEVKSLLWGSSLKEDVFSRWTQGFVFSDVEPTALVQHQGGPCAVLAPVQAFIVKCALFGEGEPDIIALKAVSNERASSYLREALKEILLQMNSSEYILVGLDRQGLQDQQTASSHRIIEEIGGSSTLPSDDSMLLRGSGSVSQCQESFHSSLRFYRCSNLDDLHTALPRAMSEFQSRFGVLLYLYSILLTKGIQQIKNEVEDPAEPLIDGIYGHGSQSLINLLLTSQATSNVWDNDKEISGLKLRGIQRQSTIGFLTLLEHMRYCEVGWFFKNPKFPIWLLGSETHLTVLFSTVESLVIRESPAMIAKHIFTQFDPEGNGFISSSLLEDVMRACDLVADTDYVNIMKNKLDSEDLGIITRSSFLEEFFPEQELEQPESFMIYHYNGLPHSCPESKVSYTEGKAVLAEEVDTQFITDMTPIKLCLQTKWPSIEIVWDSDVPPSLN